MSKKLTINEAKVLNTFDFEQEEEAFVLCSISYKPSKHVVATIGSLCNKGILEQDEDDYFWISQANYKEFLDYIKVIKTLEGYSEEYGVPFEVVYSLYDIMPNEIYDGLVTELEEISMSDEFAY